MKSFILRFSSKVCGLISLAILFGLSLAVFELTSDEFFFNEMINSLRPSSVITSLVFLLPLLCLIALSIVSGADRKLIAPTIVLTLSQVLMVLLARFPLVADAAELLRQAFSDNDYRVISLLSVRWLVSISLLIIYILALVLISMRLKVNGRTQNGLIIVRVTLMLIAISLASIVGSFLFLYLWLFLYGAIGLFLLNWDPIPPPGVVNGRKRSITILNDLD